MISRSRSAAQGAPPPGWVVDLKHPLAPGLEGFWPCNQLQGGLLIDASPQKRHSALKNMAGGAESGFQATARGPGLGMGTGADWSQFQPYTCPFPVSWSLWWFGDADGNLNNRDLVGPFADYGWKVRGNNKLSFFDGFGFHDAGTVLSVLTWYHLGLSIDAAGTLAFYVNGRPDGSGSVTPATNAWQIIGRWNNFVAAVLQNVGFWARTLAPAEFLTLYEEPWGLLSPPSPRLWPVSLGVAPTTLKRRLPRQAPKQPRPLTAW